VITINQEQRVAEAKRKAVIVAQPAIRAYMDERRFDDPDFVRAVIVEFVKLSAAMKLKQGDDEL
jgi:hypothetical protein